LNCKIYKRKQYNTLGSKKINYWHFEIEEVNKFGSKFQVLEIRKIKFYFEDIIFLIIKLFLAINKCKNLSNLEI
jgi:hypothetical protein